MYTRISTILLIASALVVFASCQDLAVDNPNEPDRETALNTPGDVESLIASQYLQWVNGAEKLYPGQNTSVMAQELTSSWGNFGMFDTGRIPREPIVNTPTYDYNEIVETPWYNLYAAISSSIEVIQQVEDEGIQLDGDEDGSETKRMVIFARFIQGLSYSALANHFDQAILVDENDQLVEEDGTPIVIDEFNDYDEVLEFGLDFLDEAITLAEDNPESFPIPGSWIRDNELSQDEFIALINSYKARFITSNARTPEEREALDWDEIADLAENGLQEDFFIDADGDMWWTYASTYPNLDTWMRASYKLIGRKDESGEFENWLNTDHLQRSEFEIDAPDERIDGDVPYVSHVGPSAFSADRGSYFFSSYAFTRNAFLHGTGFTTGPAPQFYVTELDMYRAEAKLRNGDLEGAADLINQTRVGIGDMDPVDADDGYEELFNAMRYEYEIETMGSAGGLAYYQKRGWGHLKGRDYGGLPEGTPLHFPIPAEELLGVLEMDVYTFGGSQDDEWAAPAAGGSERIRDAINANNKASEDLERH